MKHTPGPWDVDPRAAFRVYKVSEPNRGICSTGGYVANERDFTDENAANARLIAAAPDLLEACTELLKGIEDWNEAVATIVDVSHLPKWPALDKARAVIAKAKGVTNAN